MSDIRITISPELSKLATAFMDINIHKVLVQEVNRLAAAVERFGKQLTPVKTGRLRASIGFTPASIFPRTIVETNVEYAIYVHEGTRYMRARPFLKEGARLAQLSLAGELEGKLNQEIAANFKKIGGTGTLPF